MGWERVLVREVLHKEYGGLPAEAGAIIGNASSAIAIAKAFEKGEAITQKNLTVSGECVKAVSYTHLVILIHTMINNWLIQNY